MKTSSSWPPKEISLFASIDYVDDDLLHHRINLYWERHANPFRDIFTITDKKGVQLQRLIFDSLTMRLELPRQKTYRLLALHHLKESLLESTLQLEDFRLVTLSGITGNQTGIALNSSLSYTHMTVIHDTLKLFSQKSTLSKRVVFSHYVPVKNMNIPTHITITDNDKKYKTATIQIKNISENSQSALMNLFMQKIQMSSSSQNRSSKNEKSF